MDQTIISTWTEEDRLRILEQLRSIPAMRKVKLTIFYKLGLFLVSVAMIILPLIYLALIGSIGLGVYYHLAHHTSIFEGPGSKRGALVIFILPVVVGVGLLLFMIKPLFARRARKTTFFKVKEENEPFLFEFVEEITRIVGAPYPREIQLNTDVNAYAGFRKGIFSFIFTNDLSLTIGLPLIEGMNLQQLAGIIAHEFGHFTQGGAMRLSYIIRSTSGWFARLVYERDAWDENLEYWSKNIDLRLAIFLYLIRLCIWFTRRILWCLMMVGHLISCFMMRQMEYDADSCEVALEGSGNYEGTSFQLMLLALCYQIAQNDVINTWQQEGRVADNWGEMIKVSLDQLKTEDVDEIIAEAKKQTTGLFDTHPSDMDRIRAAEALNMPCLFKCDLTASVLFTNVKALAMGLSLDLYREVLDDSIEVKHLIPTSSILEKKEQAKKDVKTIDRYFQCQFSPLRILPIPELKTDSIPPYEDLHNHILNARDYILGHAERYKECIKEVEEKENRLIQLQQAKMLVDSGFYITSTEFKLPKGDIQTIRQFISTVKEEYGELGQEMGMFEYNAASRIMASVQILFSPEVELDESVIPVRDELGDFWPISKFISSIMDDIYDLNHRFHNLSILAHNLSAGGNSEQTVNMFNSSYDKMRDMMAKIIQRAGRFPYPFEHIEEDLTLGQFLTRDIPPRDAYQETFFTCMNVVDNAYNLYFRTVAKLSVISEKVESAIGLEPFIQPDDEVKEAEEKESEDRLAQMKETMEEYTVV